MKKVTITLLFLLMCSASFADVPFFNTNGEYTLITDDAKYNWTPVDQDRTLVVWWKSSSMPNADGEYLSLFQTLNDGVGNNRYSFGFAYSSGSGGALTIGPQILDDSNNTLGVLVLVQAYESTDTWHFFMLVGSDDSSTTDIYIGCEPQSAIRSSWDDNTAINPIDINIPDDFNISDDIRYGYMAWLDLAGDADFCKQVRYSPQFLFGHPNLLTLFMFDEGSGTTIIDYSESNGKNQTNGTLTGSPTWEEDSAPIDGRRG